MIGDDVLITEAYYLEKIGTLVSTLDMFVKRVNIKDAALQEKDQKIAELEAALAAKKEKK